MINVNKVKAIRAELGMTQNEFATATGIKNLAHKESSKIDFKITDIAAIVKYANEHEIQVKVSDLIVC